MSYEGEPLPLEHYARAVLRAAGRAGFATEVMGEHEPMHLYAFQRRSERPLGTVYLSTGIHGDEPAGPLALLSLLEEEALPREFDWIVFPLLNPQGAQAKTRENRLGVDLNRDYRSLRSYEAKVHINWLREHLVPLDLALFLHEDWEPEGFYLYELGVEPADSLARPILEAVERLVPINRAEEIEDFPAEDGIIRPQLEKGGRPDLPEALYIVEKAPCRRTYTLETPSCRALEERVKAQVAGVRAALAALEVQLRQVR